MLSLNESSVTKPRAWMRGVSFWGTCCGAIAILMLATGCPPDEPPCETNADCENEDFCDGAETCDVDTGLCLVGTAPCTEDQFCNENENRCDDCEEDADCDDGVDCTADSCGDDGQCANAPDNATCDDDVECTIDTCDAAAGCSNIPDNSVCDNGDFCDGEEMCDPATGDAATGCADGEAPCDPDTQTCAEATDECLDNCTTNEECEEDPPLFCTVNTCTNGVCLSTARPCNDNLFCTGSEMCDEEADMCVSAGDPCVDPQVCDEDMDACVDGTECDVDADCADDGTFCNGTESCDEANSLCASSGNPCVAPATCNEDLNRCDQPVGDMILFTLGLDNLSGTALADMFVGNLAFNAPTGTNVPTVQTGDSANGGDNTDTMTAVFNFGTVTTVAPTLTSIETVTITDFGTAATTIQGTSITGLATLNTLNSTNANALVVNNLSSVPDVGITNNTAGVSLSFVTAATMGAADDMTLALSTVTAGTLTLTSATTNGIETMNVSSTGAANTLAAITQTTGTTLATFNKTGDTSLTVTAALPATIATVNAAMDTGGLIVDVSGNTGNVTVTGGSGNDTFTVGANYTTTDTVNGNGGTDTLGLTSATAAAAANQANVTNMEALTISDGLAANVTASRFGSIATVNLQAGFTGAVTLTAASGGTVNLGARAASNDSTANGTVDVPGLGTSDAINFSINDSDTNSAYIFTGVETLNLASNNRGDGNAADGAVNTIGGALTLTPTFGTGTINLVGSAALTITGAVTAGTLTATSFTGNLVMSAASASAIVIAGGTGNDTLFGSAAGDSLNGGTGTNVFEGLAGVDSLTCGSGTDTVRILNAGASGVDRKLVSGFTAGSGGDVLNIDGDGLNVLDGTDNFATAATIQAHGSAGNLTVAAASEIVRITAGTVANLTEANSLNGTNLLTAIGGTITVQANGNEHLFLIADAAGNTGVYYGDAGADTGVVAGELTLVGVLQGTTLANLVFSNFSNAN